MLQLKLLYEETNLTRNSKCAKDPLCITRRALPMVQCQLRFLKSVSIYPYPIPPAPFFFLVGGGNGIHRSS